MRLDFLFETGQPILNHRGSGFVATMLGIGACDIVPTTTAKSFSGASQITTS